MLSALIEHNEIYTTDTKAKEIRSILEKLITKAIYINRLKKEDTKENRAKILHLTRLIARYIRNRSLITKLISEIAPRFIESQGGYTRIIKLKRRKGDNAPISLLGIIPEQRKTVSRPKEVRLGIID
jgi:large subunit ribosomal protein L17